MDEIRVSWARDDAADVADRLLRALVAEAYDGSSDDLRIGRLCPRCASSQHGRPVVLGLPGPLPGVSIARTTGTTVVALSPRDRIGIDVERADRFFAHDVAGVVLHRAERATSLAGLAATWVRKEALLKATGQGLSVDPAGIRLEEQDGAVELVEWPSASTPPAWVQDLTLGPDLVASLAGSGARGPVTVRQAGPAALRG